MIAIDPWGPLEWLVAKGSISQDVVCVGVLSAEQRCLAVPLYASRTCGATPTLLRIDDPESRFSDATRRSIAEQQAALRNMNVAHDERPIGLFASDQEISDALTAALGPGDRAVTAWLDITSMPKRFFFLMIKLALARASVRTLLVTYTQPGPAGYVNEHLAEDPEDVRPLPGFTSIFEPPTLVVAVGFETLGLPRFLDEYKDKQRRIVVLIPFPPGQPYAQRIWQTVHRLGLNAYGRDTRRVATLDAFDTMRQLEALHAGLAAGDATDSVRVALAPYGPKPVSLGMCLFAIDRNVPVFYTQPRIYHPSYTIGTGQSWGYLIKLNGVRLPLQ